MWLLKFPLTLLKLKIVLHYLNFYVGCSCIGMFVYLCVGAFGLVSRWGVNFGYQPKLFSC